MRAIGRGRLARKTPLKKAQLPPYVYADRLTTLFIRDSGTCQLCGRRVDWSLRYSLDPGRPTIDHIQAKAKGGAKYALSNQQLAHLRCNQQKGVKTMQQVSAGQPQLKTLRRRVRRMPIQQSLRSTPSLAELLRG